MRAVLSAEAVTTKAPLGLNDADLTRAVWPISSASRRRVATSQTTAVLFTEGATRRRPSALNAALSRGWELPESADGLRKLFTNSAIDVSGVMIAVLSTMVVRPGTEPQTRAVPSSDAMTRYGPSGLNAALVTAPV